MTGIEFHLGDVVQMKKNHPCGGNEWEIIRLGMDVRIKCCVCGRSVLVPRVKFTKSVKKVLRHNTNFTNPYVLPGE